MDALSTIVVAALATWQLVDVIHHSVIARPIRLWAQAAVDSGGRLALVGKAIQCPYCLSHWVAGACVLALISPLSPLFRFLALILAAVRLANLANDLVSPYSHPPRANDAESSDPPPSEATA